MSLVAWGIRLAGRGPWDELDRAAADPRATQLQLLRRILDASRGTRFGGDFGLDRVRSLGGYQRSLAIADYERLRPYVARVSEGELKVLTRQAPSLLTITSGTTGQPKLVPVTPCHARANARLTRAWLYRALLDHPGGFARSLLPIVSPDVEGLTPGGTPCGSISGRIYRDAPWLFRRAYAVPIEVFGIEDYEARYYALARIALEADVSFVGTPNPSTLVRLAAVAERYQEEIIRDVADGTLSTRIDIQHDARRSLESGLRPNPGRARELDRVFAAGSLSLSDAWPSLGLVGCWKGGSVGVQLGHARTFVGSDVAVRDLGYLASEAHMTVPISDAGAGGVLAVTANFYEFVPEADIDDADPPALLCDDLQLGQSYYVILTTQSGLYRYDINDVVRVTGFHRRTPIVEFVRKGRDMTSIGGEKLHVSQVVEAVEGAKRDLGLSLSSYRVVACAEQNRYLLLVEWEGVEPPVETARALLDGVERRLRVANVEYASKRASGRLDGPCFHTMRIGWRERRHQRRLKAGARDVQLKETLLGSDLEEGELEEIQRTVTLAPSSAAVGGQVGRPPSVAR